MYKDGIYTYQLDGTLTVNIKVTLQRSRNLDVEVYFGGLHTSPIVRHYLSLNNHSVSVVDISGTGPNSKWHRKGLGAITVNTAIQFIKALYPSDAKLGGHVFDASDFKLSTNERIVRQEERKAFWRTFGFKITPPDEIGDEFLCGKIGDLELLNTGLVLDRYPRVIPINEFAFKDF